MSHHPPLEPRKWHRRLRNWLDASGQAMVEYVLILVLIIMALAVILSITGPAVGNVFSNTVANLLNLTTTPEDPMSEGEFWALVTAVASYTPDSTVLITNTPLPDGDFDGDGIPNNSDNCSAHPNPDQADTDGDGKGNVCDSDSDDYIVDNDNDGYYDKPCTIPYPSDPQQRKKCDNCINKTNNDQADADSDGQGDVCEPPPPTATHTPGPSPTPEDNDFPFPFTDDGDEDNFETDFDTVLKGDWDASYWNVGASACSGTYPMNTTAAATEKVDAVVFPRSDHYWSSLGGKPHSSISGVANFCAKYTQTAFIAAGAYKFRIKINPTNSNANTGDRIEILVNGTSIYNDWNGISDIYYAPAYTNNAGAFTTQVTSSNQPSATNNGTFVEFNWTAPSTQDYDFQIRYVDQTSDAALEVYLAQSDFVDIGECNWTNVTSDTDGTNTFTPPPGASAFWTDSPNNVNYANSSFCILRLRGTIDLTGASFPFVEWYDIHDIGLAPDTFWLGVKRTTDSEWYMKKIHSTNSVSTSWTRREVSLSGFSGYYENTGRNTSTGERAAAPTQDFTNSTIEVAFIIEANCCNNAEGWMVGRFRTFQKTIPTYPFPFFDDLEGASHWADTSGGTWGTTTDSFSGSTAWDDRPGGNSLNNKDNWLELDGVIDMSNASGIVDPELTFWHKWGVASGASIQVEISRDLGETWQALRSSDTDASDALYTGASSNPGWTFERIPLNITTSDGKDQNLIGERFKVRFRIKTGSNTSTGWTIDDISFRNKPITSTIFPNWCDLFNSVDSLGNWVTEGNWGLGSASVGQTAFSSPTTLTDSPSGNYTHGVSSSATLDRVINISGSPNAIVEFWHRWDIAANEWLYLEMYEEVTDSWDTIWSYSHNAAPMLYDSSVTSGNSWTRQYGWQRVTVPLNSLLDSGNTEKEFQLRWRLDATSNTSVGDGWYIDNVCIRDYNDPVITLPWSDDFETSTSNNWYQAEWAYNAPVGLIIPRSGNQVIETFPTTNYAQPTDTIMELRGLIDLTSSSITKPVLYYWENYKIGGYDRMYVEVLTTNTSGIPSGTWKPIATIQSDRENTGWNRRQVDLTPYKGLNIRLRFRLMALQNTSSDAARGQWLDALSIVDRDDVETTPLTVPFSENADLGATRWVREGDWSLVTDSRQLGSGSALGPGQWNANYYRRPSGTMPFPPSLGSTNYEFIGSENMPEVDINWGNSAPLVVLTNDSNRTDRFIGHFTRTVVFATATDMIIDVLSDDGHVVVIDGAAYPNSAQWNTGCSGCTSSFVYSFTPGTHDLEIYYTENSGGAKLHVNFTPVSAGTPSSEYDPFGGVSWQARYYKYCDESGITGTPWNSTPENVPSINFNWGQENVSPIVAANNTAGTPQPGGIGGPPFTAVSGEISIPAERAHLTIASASNAWNTVDYRPGAYGTYSMQAFPDSGTNTGDTTTGPEMQYQVNFPSTGTWYMWVRATGVSASADSIHVALDDDAPVSYGNTGIIVNSSGNWAWAQNMPSGRIAFNVTTTGIHTIKLWMREDGVFVDHLFLSKNSSATPPATDPTPPFNCNTGNPKEFWAAIYERTVVVSEPTTVTFAINSNDRHRLYIAPFGGAYNPVQNQWANGNRSSSTTYNFPAGTHKVRIDFAQRFLGDGAYLNLSYVVDGAVFHSDASKGSPYRENYSASLMLENEVDLTGASSAGLTWWDRFEIGKNDFLVVEVNTVGGNDPTVSGGPTWQRIYERPGGTSSGGVVVPDWRQRFVDLTPFAGQRVVVRFRLEALNTDEELDGWYIDDIEINE